MSDEDREFLEKAMEEAFGHIEDPNKMMEEAVQQIKSEERTDASIITALEVLDKCCDDVDCARNIELLDGVQPLFDLLKTHPEGPICVRTMEILALNFSNNPKIQDVGMKRGGIKAFLKVFNARAAKSEERSKAFRAIVALVRQVQAHEETFIKKFDGVNVLVKALGEGEDAPMREKATSFAQSLSMDGRLTEEDASKILGAFPSLFGDLSDVNLQFKETLASSCAQLAVDFPKQFPSELSAAVKARFGELLRAKEPDGEQEMANLKECLGHLAKNPAAA